MLKEYVIKKLLDAALNEVHEHVVKAAVKIAPADHIHAAIPAMAIINPSNKLPNHVAREIGTK